MKLGLIYPSEFVIMFPVKLHAIQQTLYRLATLGVADPLHLDGSGCVAETGHLDLECRSLLYDRLVRLLFAQTVLLQQLLFIQYLLNVAHFPVRHTPLTPTPTKAAS